ncbi:SIMPL domain-containing protein [Caproicibacter sp.]|uniref:SIMPL domain-containing protein n=1 Tax=Caproicibacter sp. TaxID=2814884 RepID=UPI003988D5F1
MEEEKKQGSVELKKFIIAVAAALIGVVAIVGIAFSAFFRLSNSGRTSGAAQNQSGGDTITVSYTQKDRVVPDLAEISFGVVTDAKEAGDCLSQNSTDVNQVVLAIKKTGIEEKNIQTNGYSLTPRYSYTDGKEEMVGYECRTDIAVSGVSIDKVGTVLDGSAAAGVNKIDSVRYSYSKYDDAYSTALTEATGKCRALADKIAAKNGVGVKGIKAINENKEGSAPPVVYNSSMKLTADAAESSTQAAAGQIDVNASVIITYEIEK